MRIPDSRLKITAGRGSRFARVLAFSLIELMLAIAILGIIVYALYTVFNQTQRALRASETQTDVSEKARAIMEMVSRELEQAQPTFVSMPGANGPIQEDNLFGGPEYPPIVQEAVRQDVRNRTNFLHNIYFYNQRTNAWQGIGYRVVYVTNGVGVLQRFETAPRLGQRPMYNELSSQFKSEPLESTNYHRVADGVIHLTFVPYDRNGYRLGFDTVNSLSGTYSIYRANATGTRMFGEQRTNALANVVLVEAYPDPGETRAYASSFAFRSNALPAYIDMELGILEPETLSQYRTMLMDNNPNALAFLKRQINKVHLFRQRIPIRTAAQ